MMFGLASLVCLVVAVASALGLVLIARFGSPRAAWSALDRATDASLAVVGGSTRPLDVGAPEPIHTWICEACAVADGGVSWLYAPPGDAVRMLGDDWGVRDRASFERAFATLTERPPHAWEDARAIRLAMAAHRANLLPARELWEGIRPTALRLQRRYPNFEALWIDYQLGLRNWLRLPLDGSADATHPVARVCSENIERARSRPPRVSYEAML